MIRIALTVVTIVLALAACGRPQDPATGSSAGRPHLPEESGSLRFAQDSTRAEISAEKISRDVVGRVVEISEMSGIGPTDKWTFEAEEYRRIDILGRQPGPNGVDLHIFMLTRSNPKPDEATVQVSGQLRLHYDWKGNQWVLRNIDNLTFRYSLGQVI